MRRASHTHQAPHIGLPQIAPVIRAIKVYTAPMGAMANAAISEIRSCQTIPINAAMAIDM
ncbi:Uncharacterised protein [Vibrio cholerae]|uniref:Uncharacterized protein n=1 Tax=Vibrio cholerae TaxID=666 RepID=A0A656APA2_VIBCL|nr:Uncharacterised protein [Vibrio cholerae]CSD26175.1 Uncharacterised protein [Vibrio cholerae]